MILKIAIAVGAVLIAGWLLSWLVPENPRQKERGERPKQLAACPRCGAYAPNGQCNCEDKT